MNLLESNKSNGEAGPSNSSPMICNGGLHGFNFYLVAYVCTLIALLGIPSNALTVCVLRADKKRNTARYLMLTLATQDMLLIMLYLVYYILPLFHQHFNIFPVFMKYIWSADSPILFFLSWFKFAEAYTIVSISIDRFVALRFPFKSASICTISNARRGQCLIWTVGVATKLPILVLDFCYYDWANACDLCTPVFQNQEWYAHFHLVYVQLFDQIVTFLIPLSCLIFLNVYLIRQLHEVDHLKVLRGQASANENSGDASGDTQYNVKNVSLKNRASPTNDHTNPIKPTDEYSPRDFEQQSRFNRHYRKTHQARNISAMLVCVISMFIICETPTALYFFLEINAKIKMVEASKETQRSIYSIALFMAMVNFASNFVIYGLVGRRFRWVLKKSISRWIYILLHCEKPRRRPQNRLQPIRLKARLASHSYSNLHAGKHVQT